MNLFRTPSARAWLSLLLTALAIRLFWGAILTRPLDWLCLDLYPSWVAVRLYDAGIYEAIYNPALWISGREHPAWAALMKANHIPDADGTSFVYGPAWLLLVAPILRHVSLAAASRGLLAVNAVAVVVIAAECARLARRDSLRWALVLSAIFALSLPVLGAVWLGQNTLIALALALVGARLLLREDRAGDLGAALLWALAAAAKPWFIASFGVLVALRRWRALSLSAALWATVTLAIPALLVPDAVRAGYAEVTARLLKITVVPWNDVSVRAHLTRLLWPEWPRYALEWVPVEVPRWMLLGESVGMAAVGVLGLAWVWRRRPPAELTVALGLVAALLPLGVCWTHYLAFALPLAVVALGHPALNRGARWAGAAALAFGVVGQTCWLPTVLHDKMSPEGYQALASSHPLLVAHLIEAPMYAVIALAMAVVGSVKPVVPTDT